MTVRLRLRTLASLIGSVVVRSLSLREGVKVGAYLGRALTLRSPSGRGRWQLVNWSNYSTGVGT